MFGILYTIFMSIGGFGYNYKQTIKEQGRREKAYTSYDRTYYDKKGKRRLVDNNRWVTSDVVNGDRVLRDVDTGKIYRNFSNEQRNKKWAKLKQEAIEKGKTVYLYIYSSQIPLEDPWKGDRYKDITTGDVYVIRRQYLNLNGGRDCKFYVNIKTGLYVRKTDEQIIKDQYWYKKLETVKEDTIRFNKNKKQYKNLSKEQFDKEMEKEIKKNIHSIKNCFVADDRINEVIDQLNLKQKYYKQQNDRLFYGFQ